MNCIIIEDDELVRHSLETLIKETEFLHLVKSCTKTSEAANILKKEDIDIIFLDVKLPGKNGVEFINTIDLNRTQVIMITADKSSAVDAFNMDACDFILKPITRPRLLKAIYKAQRILSINEQNSNNIDALYVKVNSVLKRVDMAEILYIEAMADYLTIYTATQKFVLKSTMKNIMSKLPIKGFIRVHNSFIININKVTSIEEANVLIGKKVIPISRNKRKGLMTSLNLL